MHLPDGRRLYAAPCGIRTKWPPGKCHIEIPSMFSFYTHAEVELQSLARFSSLLCDKYDIFFKNIKGIFKGEVRLCLQQHNNPKGSESPNQSRWDFFHPLTTRLYDFYYTTWPALQGKSFDKAIKWIKNQKIWHGSAELDIQQIFFVRNIISYVQCPPYQDLSPLSFEMMMYV